MGAVRPQLLRLALIAMLVASLGFALATTARAGEWAHNIGLHQICAADVTIYNSGEIGRFYYGYNVYISRFGEGENHAWISSWNANRGELLRNINGWIYNGWFC